MGRVKRARIGRLGSGFLLAWVAGCAGPPPPPEVLLVPTQIDGGFLVRQKITGHFDGHSQSFEAVLQKRGPTLTVIGLTPYGTKAFVLIQEGKQLNFESFMPEGRSLPLDPNYLLQDIHHAFFLTPDSETSEVCSQTVADDGRVLVRTFRRASDLEGAAVVVSYTGRVEGQVFPERVTLDNGYYGYSLTIETVSYQALD